MSDDNSDVVVVAKKITKKFIPWDDDLALEVLVNAFQMRKRTPFFSPPPEFFSPDFFKTPVFN
jgi:hypothetical protein